MTTSVGAGVIPTRITFIPSGNATKPPASGVRAIAAQRCARKKPAKKKPPVDALRCDGPNSWPRTAGRRSGSAMRCKVHHHPCQSCGVKTECGGVYEQNYDGFPEVTCPEFHMPDGTLNKDFL